ncbi:hypothetical protein Bbelb_393910 [Branchiostoma belcheri]|nr:hypothetical protein Bbelb_393910 [Branchiostoma belcheri]
MADHIIGTVATLNRELSTVSTWLSTWKLDKCKVMFITTRALLQPIPPVTLGGTVLQVVTSHKHLGVTLTNTLSWSQHIEVISTKARRSSGLLCALRRKIPQNLLLRLYITITNWVMGITNRARFWTVRPCPVLCPLRHGMGRAQFETQQWSPFHDSYRGR